MYVYVYIYNTHVYIYIYIYTHTITVIVVIVIIMGNMHTERERMSDSRRTQEGRDKPARVSIGKIMHRLYRNIRAHFGCACMHVIPYILSRV